MATEIDVQFEDEGGDNPGRMEDLQYKPDTMQIEWDSPPSPLTTNVPPFSMQTPTKEELAKKRQEERDTEKILRSLSKRNKEQQAAERRKLREQQQDQARADREQARARMRQSQEEVRAARSDAISQRVQSYSAAAALGLPGYVFANVIDTTLIRPKEDARVQQQKEYQRQLETYNEQVAKDREQKKRQQEEAIRNRPVEAYIKPNKQLDMFGNPLASGTTAPPTPPVGGSGGSGQGGGQGGGGNIPPSNTPPVGPGSPSSNQGQGGGGGTPPPIPPTPPPAPTPGTDWLTNLGPVGLGVAAGVRLGQTINRQIDAAAKEVQSFTGSVVSGDATGGLKQGAGIAGRLLDPLGSNVVINTAVQGFDTLITVNEQIRDSIRKDAAFAPQTLEATVLGDISKLVQRIEIARRLDPVTMELTKVNTQLELQWAELRASLIEALGPAIIFNMNVIVENLKLLNTGVDVVSSVARYLPGGIGAIIEILEFIAWLMPKPKSDLDQSNILQQFKDFTDPTVTLGRMPPGTVPNP
jgi:hypothetical protein